MQAPADLVARFDRTLVSAIEANPPLKEREALAVVRAITDFGERAVAASQLRVGLAAARQFEDAPPKQQVEMRRHDMFVEPIARIAHELLRYQEVTSFLLANATTPLVQGLLGLKSARDNLGRRVLRTITLANPSNVTVTLGSHRLTFLVREGSNENGCSLVIDEEAYLPCARPVVLASTGAGPDHALVECIPPHVTSAAKAAPRHPYPVVVDLARKRSAEPAGSLQAFHEPGLGLKDLQDDGVALVREGGESFSVPFEKLRYARLEPFH